MILRRHKKQLAYGLGAAGTIVALVLLATINPLGNPSSGLASPSPTPQFLPIALEHVDVIQHPGQGGQDATVDLVARLRNPNPAAGVASLDISFVLHDSGGQELTRVSRPTYLLPGSIQYVMAFSVPLQHRTLGQVEAEFNRQPPFTVLPESVTLPQFSAFAKTRGGKNLAGQAIEEQRGIVKNTSTFDWGKVEVYVVGLDAEGTAVATGQTFVGALTVGEEREFIMTWPAPARPIDRLVILPSTNMYREDNVLRTIGDPGLLR